LNASEAPLPGPTQSPQTRGAIEPRASGRTSSHPHPRVQQRLPTRRPNSARPDRGIVESGYGQQARCRLIDSAVGNLEVRLPTLAVSRHMAPCLDADAVFGNGEHHASKSLARRATTSTRCRTSSSGIRVRRCGRRSTALRRRRASHRRCRGSRRPRGFRARRCASGGAEMHPTLGI
jgi:hypothetical protein